MQQSKNGIKKLVLMSLPIKHTYGKTPQGLIFEKYASTRYTEKRASDDELEFIILAGVNTSPGKIEKRAEHFNDYSDLEKSNYFGTFPATLTYHSGQPVTVLYQAGVSGGKHKKGFYSSETTRLQLEESLATSTGTKIYPITHSLSSLAGLDVVTGAEYASDSRLLAGTISSVLTTAEDALSEIDSPRRLCGIKWISLMQAFKNLDFTLPVYPLAAQYWHDWNTNIGQDSENHGALPYLNLNSACYLLDTNGLEKAQQPKVKDPLLIITTCDRIFSVKEQMKVAEALEADTIKVPAGHRWFTLPQPELSYIAKRIIIHSGRKLIL